ncbi:hypothetical protein TrLO_g10512 [Triparma laevis f. longispina]|uniref:Transmembrane protein n=1 Tax=Triparma laevis f. longispina TaxID=1714387 RepID=A0A9W7FMF5_9STRA|nr:hypothetical protein TrLO_g10512 [Triparma laevis f. longispina]
MQLRHPQEAGGFAFLVSVLLSLVGSLVLAYIYSNYDDDEEGVNIEIDDDTLKATLINLYSVWLFSIEHEMPAWFTDRWVECVPNEYIPFEWRVRYRKMRGRVDDPKRRRGSVSVRELLGEKEMK